MGAEFEIVGGDFSAVLETGLGKLLPPGSCLLATWQERMFWDEFSTQRTGIVIDKELLDILACPDSKEPVYLAHESVVEELNRRIEAGGVANRGGKPVEKKMDGGLVREDGAYLYPIEDDIPIMLIDEAIPIGEMGVQAKRAEPPE